MGYLKNLKAEHFFFNINDQNLVKFWGFLMLASAFGRFVYSSIATGKNRYLNLQKVD